MYLWRAQRSQGRFGWKETPFTRLDLDSNFVSISAPMAVWHGAETAQRRGSAHARAKSGRGDGGLRKNETGYLVVVADRDCSFYEGGVVDAWHFSAGREEPSGHAG